MSEDKRLINLINELCIKYPVFNAVELLGIAKKSEGFADLIFLWKQSVFCKYDKEVAEIEADIYDSIIDHSYNQDIEIKYAETNIDSQFKHKELNFQHLSDIINLDISCSSWKIQTPADVDRVFSARKKAKYGLQKIIECFGTISSIANKIGMPQLALERFLFSMAETRSQTLAHIFNAIELPPLIIRFVPEDNSVAIEFRAKDCRFLFSIEDTHSEIGWSIIFKDQEPMFGDLIGLIQGLNLIKDIQEH
jgi:hypothetical protein